MRLELDRIRLDDTGGNSERLAAGIHDQLTGVTGPVPVHDIARALDIEEIRVEPLRSFEGALITTPEGGRGAIVVNARSSPQRQRYTVAHELGHFLNPWHKPTKPGRFECTRADMMVTSGKNDHFRQESEANRFAIELLAPGKRIAFYLSGSADLQRAFAMASDLNISKAAAVRRYVALHHEALAVVFSRGGVILYIERREEFPFLSIWNGNRLPMLQPRNHGPALSDWDQLDAADWLRSVPSRELFAQTLRQADGYAITLLHANASEDVDDVDQQSIGFRR